MTVPIYLPAALIFLVSSAVGWAVYRHTRMTSTALPKTGDLGVAFGAFLTTLTALGFLFGVSTDRSTSPAVRPPAATVTGTPDVGASGAADPNAG